MAEAKELVLFEAKSGIFHRSRVPAEYDRRGAVLFRKSACGHWHTFSCSRLVAEKTGRFPCKICFR